jgi:hypothetical protein
MIQVGRAIISLDVIEKQFVCDLESCKGVCCVEGDSGAPLSESETQILETIFPSVKPYMTEKGIKAVEEQGFYIIDNDGDLVTPLIDNKECAYVTYNEQITLCAIEKAFFDKKIDFRKPISCHLYPIRITEYSELDAVNYDKQSICKAACTLGRKLKVPVFEFLKDPLIRKYGEDWYKELEIAAQLLKVDN